MPTEMLYALRDQAGVPSHPAIFLILGVLTFALHMAAVQVMLGASALTLRGAFDSDLRWRRLAHAMLLTAKIAVSVAIVIGVAPLLFVQVVYDPFWYTSNVLSAWWVMAFIAFLIAGYICMYAFYWKNHDIVQHGGRSGYWMVLSLGFLLAVGFIVHSLSNQMFYPEQWMNWYAPEGQINPNGQRLHQWHLPRFLFFIALSAPVTGAWMLAYRRYLQGANETDLDYLQFLLKTALRWMLVGGVLSLVLGAVWMLTLPEKMQWFAGSIWMWIAVAALLFVVGLPVALRQRLDTGVWGYAIFGLGAVALIVVGASREVMRFITLLGAHGYNALDYRINMDWYSTTLFFTTFVVLGGFTLTYLLAVAWQAGQHKDGIYTPGPRLTRLGQWSVGLLVAWTLSYFGVGIWVWAEGAPELAARATVEPVASVKAKAVPATDQPAPVNASLAASTVPADTMAHSCAACHGTHGQLADEYFAPLAGMPSEQFVATMVEFREGRRPATLMGLVAQGFSDKDLKEMGDFFAAQKRGETP